MFSEEYTATVEAVSTAVQGFKRLSVVTESTGLIKALQAKRPALLVNPPGITFETWNIWRSEYMLLLVAPRSSSNVKAAAELAPIIEALATKLPGGIDAARPHDYTIGDENYIIPAYEITYSGE